ncbi:hypothetical protein [Nocardiopsis sp. YSL2]|uniref:hypothetical protein n=1 Tax=Nocardiopsis sp. YSL2 TaxID=2939492 RepID=UPI0026F42473|nr:hypothetical protein [Nocardiopsis sp. YSL2]
MSDPRADDQFVVLLSEVENNGRQLLPPDQYTPREGWRYDLNDDPALTVEVTVLTKSVRLTGELIGEFTYRKEMAERLHKSGRSTNANRIARNEAFEASQRLLESRSAVRPVMEGLYDINTAKTTVERLREHLPEFVHLRVADSDQPILWRVPLDEVDNWALVQVQATSN